MVDHPNWRTLRERHRGTEPTRYECFLKCDPQKIQKLVLSPCRNPVLNGICQSRLRQASANSQAQIATGQQQIVVGGPGQPNRARAQGHQDILVAAAAQPHCASRSVHSNLEDHNLTSPNLPWGPKNVSYITMARNPNFRKKANLGHLICKGAQLLHLCLQEAGHPTSGRMGDKGHSWLRVPNVPCSP